MATGGGAVMLLLAAGAHDAASVPLLVIGGAWLVMGIAGIAAGQRYAREIVLDGSGVHFISPRNQVDVSAGDIIEIGHAAWDLNRMGTLSVRTSTHGTIKTAPRLTGLIDLLVELRRLNPSITYRNV